MAVSLAKIIERYQEGSGLLWVDFLDYAQRLFSLAGSVAVQDLVMTISQGQSLIRSDVVSVSAKAVYSQLSLGSVHEEIRALESIQKVFANAEPKTRLAAVLKGVAAVIGRECPLVLQVPSPKQWIKGMMPPNSSWDTDPYLLDGASVYMAEFLRDFSDVGISGLVIQEKEPGDNLAELLDIYQPVSNVARHYQWSFGFEWEGAFPVPLDDLLPLVDFLLLPTCQQSSVEDFWKNRVPVGGGLTDSFWASGELESMSSSRFGYGAIPAGANPENVLRILALWRDRQ